MEQNFYIMIHLKVKGELQTIGKFYIGNKQPKAYALFKKLKGNSAADGTEVLFMELTETRSELPVNIKMISCTLDELSGNCRTITKEIFKWNNMDLLH
ncbi:hypothetical protein [Pseudobacter ginsenosidimutans]|uniref:Uncharacterized protein n=1 Tax=Pseudobacter ginsenosidimutans TaxID=661488 RepID=A0A4V2F0P4_9BACT|nr:hypothetical protein [Pseudobacter ginsenosidimutans]QEC42313.1 hypothetical protein FSB84_11655 [Pseudobacter ginsenosidimutans]RZS70841.1 hypothetical protein EV199_2736 [Pseudobacter ginsenosidimutans]